ncbi:Uma2 family endonuclease [Streptomyces hawaiiensis]|jgi:hypothetical protein|uniref:Uma2 family endonuclease n=1 Tax=Streptomyces hawaiiensis TaxID=67305 RepID=UPI003647E012
MERHPGYRVEIIGGHLLVIPSPDAPHARALTKLMRPFIAAGLDDGETEVLHNVGLWLPTGGEDYAIPDLVVVDADIDDHFVENNAYDPACFRLVLVVALPDSIGAKVTLDVAEILRAGQPRTSD